jgi:hypothetical protein
MAFDGGELIRRAMGDSPLNQGEWLRAAVADQGITVAKFCRRSGLRHRNFARWFSQPELHIKLEHAVRILTALDIDASRLLRLTSQASVDVPGDGGMQP